MDQALQADYGFDRMGLYNAWRDSVHLSGPGSKKQIERRAALAQRRRQAEPQPANSGSNAGSSPSRGNSPDPAGDHGATVLLVTLGGALAVLLIAAAVGIGIALSRRTQS